MPKFLSAEAIDLIKRLLDRHPMSRLGAGPDGAKEVKNHPFFKGLDWQDVYNKKTFPPERKKKNIKYKQIPLDDFLDPPSLHILQKEKMKVENWSFIKQK